MLVSHLWLHNASTTTCCPLVVEHQMTRRVTIRKLPCRLARESQAEDSCVTQQHVMTTSGNVWLAPSQHLPHLVNATQASAKRLAECACAANKLCMDCSLSYSTTTTQHAGAHSACWLPPPDSTAAAAAASAHTLHNTHQQLLHIPAGACLLADRSAVGHPTNNTRVQLRPAGP